MQFQSILKNFGLNDKEIAVYSALIELGPSPVRVIAQKSKVNRGTTYDILRSLMEQGLVTYYNTETHQHFAAESPEKLVTALENRKRDIGQLEEEIKASLPELRSLFDREGGRPQVRLYEGAKGVRQILEDVLTTVSSPESKEYFEYSSESLRNEVREAMPEFTKKRIKLGIAVKTIALGPGGDVAGLDERKWLPAEFHNERTTYELIYNGKVAHISVNDAGTLVGVVIENKDIYNTQKMIFQFNWSHLRSS